MISTKTLIGLSLILTSFVTIYFATPVAIGLGVLTTLLVTWTVVVLLAAGTFLVLRLSLRVSVTSILFAFVLMLPISIIYMTPLPGNSQFLLGSLIALVAVLAIRLYKRPNRTKTKATARKEANS